MYIRDTPRLYLNRPAQSWYLAHTLLLSQPANPRLRPPLPPFEAKPIQLIALTGRRVPHGPGVRDVFHCMARGRGPDRTQGLTVVVSPCYCASATVPTVLERSNRWIWRLSRADEDSSPLLSPQLPSPRRADQAASVPSHRTRPHRPSSR